VAKNDNYLVNFCERGLSVTCLWHIVVEKFQRIV